MHGKYESYCVHEPCGDHNLYSPICDVIYRDIYNYEVDYSASNHVEVGIQYQCIWIGYYALTGIKCEDRNDNSC